MMRKIDLLTVALAVWLSLFACSGVSAQEEMPTPTEGQNQNLPPKKSPGRILRELELSREQIRQIRSINQSRRPLMQAAQKSWREAQRNLDLAIYADETDQEAIELRLKEAQTAYSEFIKARSVTEFLIRQVLTPGQLQKFRQFRDQVKQRNKPSQQDRNINNPENRDTPPEPPRRLRPRRKSQIAPF
jgi:Spy/CpxP family protein refolding chaperone